SITTTVTGRVSREQTANRSFRLGARRQLLAAQTLQPRSSVPCRDDVALGLEDPRRFLEYDLGFIVSSARLNDLSEVRQHRGFRVGFLRPPDQLQRLPNQPFCLVEQTPPSEDPTTDRSPEEL